MGGVKTEKLQAAGRRWMRELEAAERAQRDWFDARTRAWKHYRNEGASSVGAGMDVPESAPKSAQAYLRAARANFFWEIIESQIPHIYSKKPTPVIRRRAGQPGVIAATAAAMLQKCVEVSLDDERRDPHKAFLRTCRDFMIGGWGHSEVRYEPEKDPPLRDPVPVRLYNDGSWRDAQEEVVPTAMVVVDEDSENEGTYRPGPQPGERMIPESVRVRYLNQSKVLLHPAETWEDCEWVATLERFTKREVLERWGERVAERMTYRDRKDEGKTAVELWERCELWRIHDRVNREVVWADARMFRAQHQEQDDRKEQDEIPMHLGETEEFVVHVEEDDYLLDGFFPFPEPVTTVPSNDCLTPRPELTQYESVLLTLNELMMRWFFVIYAIRFKGIVPGDRKEIIEKAMGGPPWVQLIEATAAGIGVDDINKLVTWIPMDVLVNGARDTGQIINLVKAVLFEVSGATDPMRASIHPRQSNVATQAQMTYGAGRTSMKRTAFEMHLREVIRLMAEVISKHFSFETIMRMSGIVLRSQEKITAEIEGIEETQTQKRAEAEGAQDEDTKNQANTALAEMANKLAELRKEAPREAVEALLRNSAIHDYVFDMETRSTVLEDQQVEQEHQAKMMESAIRAMQALGQMLELGALPPEMAGEVLAMLLQDMPHNREVIQKIRDHKPLPQPQAPNPDAEKGKTQIRLLQMELGHKVTEGEKARANAKEIVRMRTEAADRSTEMKERVAALEARVDKEVAQLENAVKAAAAREQGKTQERIAGESRKAAAAAAAATGEE